MKKVTKIIVSFMFLVAICVIAGVVINSMTKEQPLGSLKNPQKLETLGEVKVQLEAEDKDGYYYSWKANKDDVLKFEMTDAPIEVDYDIILKNENERVSLTEDGIISNGIKTVSIVVEKGDAVLIQLITKPDKETGKYPKAELTAFGEVGAGDRY